MRAAYIGHEVLMFSDYTDLATGRTLYAEPGGVYDIAPASGRPVPDFPAPWFVAASDEGEQAPEPEPEPQADPEPQSEPEPEPGTEEGQSF